MVPNRLACAGALLSLFASFATCLPASAQKTASLRTLASQRKLRFGTAAGIGLLRSDADAGVYRNTTATEFDMIEPENEFKPPAIWLGPDTYDWSNADWLIGAPGQTGWAQANHLAVRGHVLVYARDDGYTLPDWLRKRESTITPAQARQYLHDYIHAVVSRYRGKVFAWDVVNEAIDDNPNSNPYRLRNSFWYRKLGPDFIKLAFQYAHEADPRAQLYLNEYGAEGMGSKSDAVFDILKWLKHQGVYVTGAGMQYHLSIDDPITAGDAHYQNVSRLHAAGFTFMVTELDVHVPVTDPGIGFHASNVADLDRQAAIYREVLQLALNSPNCRGFQVWGYVDTHSWIPAVSPGRGAATLMDDHYQPKRAYYALQQALGAPVTASNGFALH